MRADNILCEYLDNPIGLGIKQPRITWNDYGIVKQKAFEISYSTGGQDFTSGVVYSSSMNYSFPHPFKSRDTVSYRIRIMNEKDEWSDYSEPHTFEMGLLEKSDFSAQWITGDYSPAANKRYPCDYFRKNFEASAVGKIIKARLYITACGIYEAHINGKRVGNFVLAPGSTDYTKRLQCQAYDVTALVTEENNVIEVILADGWYRGSIGAKGFTCVYGKQTKFTARLELTGETGGMCVISDGSWDWSSDGPVRFADLKDGEIVDGRMIPSYRGKAREIKFGANLTYSDNTFVSEHECTAPKNIYKSPSGKTILEFENNVAGYLAFDITGKDGDRVDIVLGEILDDSGEVTLKNVQCVRRGKKTPLQEIHYVCREGCNSYHPKFFIAGFKYASVDTELTLNPGDFKQIAIYTDLRETSHFECSNKLINIFYENTLRSLKSNSADIPTDCPTRERMGWTGDSQVFFETASFLTDYSAFARKHVMDIYDRQDKSGRLPQIAPYSAEDWFMDVMNGSVGWADAGILIPYRHYRKYGDLRILTDNFDNMEKYAKFMIKRCGRAKGIYSVYARPLHLTGKNRKYQVNTGQSYGEWAEPNDVKPYDWTDFCMPHPEESMAYTVWMMRLMSEICSITGRTENKKLYDEYAEGVRDAYEELVTKKKYSLDTDRQAKLVRPLQLELLSGEKRKYAEKRLIKALDNYGWRLGTGFLSTPFILNVLSEIDKEYAYRLLENEEMPGWLFMAKNSTGTIWEGWEGPKAQLGISSLNHYSKGAMTEWLFNGMCGINIAGENRFLLKPVIGGKEQYASAFYDSVYGRVALSWKKEKGNIIIDMEIPGNTEAEFVYGNSCEHLQPGSHHFEYGEI